MTIYENFSLKSFNYYGVDVKAKYFVEISRVEDIEELFRSKKLSDLPVLFLGAGSNTLFVNDFEGIVIKSRILGKEIIKEDGDDVFVEVGSGEDWPEYVMWAVNQGLSGIENLAYLPGEIGAAPVQNIGAYGQVFEDVCDSVKGFDISTEEHKSLRTDECQFDYRSSIFKTELRDKFFVTSAVMKLSKIPHYDTAYRSGKPTETITAWLEKIATPPYTPLDVANAVTELRKSKLPDWRKIGTIGSFFKNPFVTVEKFLELQAEDPGLICYPTKKMVYTDVQALIASSEPTDLVKIPAARLIDVGIGYRGRWNGHVGTHETQALCIVSDKQATGQEIYDFAMEISDKVFEKYGIRLESEVCIIQ